MIREIVCGLYHMYGVKKVLGIDVSDYLTSSLFVYMEFTFLLLLWGFPTKDKQIREKFLEPLMLSGSELLIIAHHLDVLIKTYKFLLHGLLHQMCQPTIFMLVYAFSLIRRCCKKYNSSFNKLVH